MGRWMAPALVAALLLLGGVGSLVTAGPVAGMTEADGVAVHAHRTIPGTGAGGQAPPPPGPSLLAGPVTVSTCATPAVGTYAQPPSPQVDLCTPAPVPDAPGTHTLLRGSHCVDHDAGTGDFRIRVVYARAFDDTDFQKEDDDLRAMHLMANQRVDTDGLRGGKHADLPTECQQGHIKIWRQTLWTPLALTQAGTIWGDLATRPDFNQPHVKSWVYFDHVDPMFPGQFLGDSMWFNDTTPGTANLNNGNAMTWMVSWESDWHTWLHEGAHTMGAVSWVGPPHATGGGHCFDRLDIVCYNDGSALGALYGVQPNNCTVFTFDCGGDDYFNTSPPPGSYLANNWNLGAADNRFMRLEGSQVRLPVLCDADRLAPGMPITCRFAGGNPEASAVDLRIDWGDGTVDTLPGVPVDQTVSAQHNYAQNGAFRIHVTASDVGGAPNPSGAVPWDVKVDGPEPPLTIQRPGRP